MKLCQFARVDEVGASIGDDLPRVNGSPHRLLAALDTEGELTDREAKG